jgi:hypothetical protein
VLYTSVYCIRFLRLLCWTAQHTGTLDNMLYSTCGCMTLLMYVECDCSCIILVTRALAVHPAAVRFCGQPQWWCAGDGSELGLYHV